MITVATTDGTKATASDGADIVTWGGDLNFGYNDASLTEYSLDTCEPYERHIIGTYRIGAGEGGTFPGFNPRRARTTQDGDTTRRCSP